MKMEWAMADQIAHATVQCWQGRRVRFGLLAYLNFDALVQRCAQALVANTDREAALAAVDSILYETNEQLDAIGELYAGHGYPSWGARREGRVS